jgi:hypothetical protein
MADTNHAQRRLETRAGFNPIKEDDPYADLFAGLTWQEALQLRKELDEAEASEQNG